MAFPTTSSFSPRAKLDHAATTPSPLRHASTASTNSSASSNFSNPFPPSRTSTVSSNGSDPYYTMQPSHRRGLSEATGLAAHSVIYEKPQLTTPTNASPYGNAREALRPISQGQSLSPPSKTSTPSAIHSRAQMFEQATTTLSREPPSPTNKARNQTMALGRSGSVRGTKDSLHSGSRRQHTHSSSQSHVLDKPDLKDFQRATTGHLRTLSKMTGNAPQDEFSIKSPEQEVTGMHGRMRLQRTGQAAAGYGSRNWMDQQRQFLQAYEYLCHIGEAKEWIEDVIDKPIPPIVELEQALRNGVTLAEIVQTLNPEKQIRIFRHEKLQFRHSDNIAAFFRLLGEVELPELFWFELVDLYEKKNIPKVIYCIHALSWLLYRQGRLDFRIGNLVGQLHFEDHELEATQKGLDSAGVSMPNFSGMSAKFVDEPVETPEERFARELHRTEGLILDLQSQFRGALLRFQLGDSMQRMWNTEEALLDLQSRLRAEWSRQIFQYRLHKARATTQLQSAIRGVLVRSLRRDEELYWQNSERQIRLVQNVFRGRKGRKEANAHRQYIQNVFRRHEEGIRQLQAAVRGAIERSEVADNYFAVQDRSNTVAPLQGLIRGMLQRQAVSHQVREIENHEQQIISLQAAAKAIVSRAKLSRARQQIETKQIQISSLQSAIRAKVAQKVLQATRQKTAENAPQVIQLQSLLRGSNTRLEVSNTRAALDSLSSHIISVQDRIRGSQIRTSRRSIVRHINAQSPKILELQSTIRGASTRQGIFNLLNNLNQNAGTITDLLSCVRGMMARRRVEDILTFLDGREAAITGLQQLARGMMVRIKFAEKRKYFRENMQKVIKIQSFVRARQQGEAYKSLTSGENPPVGTIKNFVHLLNDSDFDFDEEIEFERMRKTVTQNVRQNEMAEQYIDQLDIKIALLVKNKITLDEVVKHQKHFGGHVGSLLTNKDIASKDPFDLKALNKNSRRKLEHYQEMFFMLQTQPQYLGRLFRRLRDKSLGDNECRRVELLMMGLFGFAQKRREEYYLLKLIVRSIQHEVDDSSSVQDYFRGSFFWTRLFTNYVRSPRDRKFYKQLFGPLVKENIIENEALDLESDPMQIYRSAINNEELRTGQQSRRNPNIPREEAIKDPETRDTFICHLQDLRDISDQFLLTLEEILYKMPFGVRFVAQQMFHLLCNKFPYEDQQHILYLVGQWIWKMYLQPALMQPEMCGVVDRGLSPMQKRNIGEVVKVLSQVASAKLFGGDNVYLLPMNSYVGDAINRIGDIWNQLVTVGDAESNFDIDEFNDLYSRTKPTLYIKLADVFAIHQLVAQDVAYVCPGHNDVLRDVVRELGSAKSNENEMLGVSSTEIRLTLNPKLVDNEDPQAETKALFMETKRCVLYIIRVQTGSNLMEIMVKPVLPEDEAKWAALVREEQESQHQAQHHRRRSRNPYTSEQPSSALTDITRLTYGDLKRIGLENIIELDRRGRISRSNNYQDLLNAIAIDIRTKHRRRIQRTRELEGVRATLVALDEKAAWLDSQLKSYNDYIEQAMVTLQNKKGKKRFLLPFTRQYNHERELQRSGRVPRFGSYKYSARQLADKGVLVHWQGYYHPGEGGHVMGHSASGGGGVGAGGSSSGEKAALTISSDEVGVFHVEGSVGSMMIPGASAAVPLDELLQAQFNNCQFVNLFGENAAATATARPGTGGKGTSGAREGGGGGGGREGGVGGVGPDGPLKLNVNLLVHLVMKKFYRDE